MSGWGRVWVIGGGAVASTLLPLLSRSALLRNRTVTVVAPAGRALTNACRYNFQAARATFDINRHRPKAGDAVVNLAGLDSLELARRCSERNVLYMDTSLENPRTLLENSRAPSTYSQYRVSIRHVASGLVTRPRLWWAMVATPAWSLIFARRH